MTNTIEDILKSGKPGNYSNITISDSVKRKLLGSIKDEKRPNQMKRTQKLKEMIHRLEHKAFVNCVEWAKTCDIAKLSNRGVM